jgi:gliding motility-associated-like protein
MRKILLSTIFISTLCLQAAAQLITENTLTVQQYVQDVLLGANVTVTNIQYNSATANTVSTAIGGFDCPDCNLGIASGFAMSSGGVDGLVGPNNSTAYTGTGSGLMTGNDADLLDLVQANGGTSIHDWAIIEFDFIPLGDTIRFNYVWGSEEYDTYVGSGFNDVFGFFISGPGISGPFSNNAMNIAIVPGTIDTGVAINTINNGQGNAGPCTNCDYYNQLDADGDAWDNMDDDIHTNPYYIQFDGYTDVLTAMAVVQCGQTYHIKLAICDANDSALDSGIFLERDSFSSNLVVQVELDLDVSGPNGDTMFETCGSGNITFDRPESGNPNTQLVAYLSYSGTAQMGVDYSVLPDSVVFAPGVMSISIPLDAYEDFLTEGLESVHMEIDNIADCGETMVSSSFDFFIADNADPLVVEGYDIEICSGESVTLEPIISGGYAVYTFDWSTNETTATIDVTPGLTTTYFLTVGDTCGLPSDDAQFMVTVLITPQLVIDLDQPSPQLIECGSGVDLSATTSGGVNPYTWTWTSPDGWDLWGWENTLFYSSWNGEGYCYVTVEDQCGFTATDSILIEMNSPPLVVDIPSTMQVECNDNFTVEAIVTGGDNNYWYSWTLNGVPDWNQWSNTFNGTGTEDGILNFTVSDNCGQSATQDVAIEIVSPPIELTLVDSLQGTCFTNFNIIPVLNGGSGSSNSWNYQWLEQGNPIGFNSNLTFNTPESTSLTLQVEDLCGATATDNIIVTIENPDLTLSIGEDVNASCLDQTTFVPQPTGGSGGFTFQWTVDGAPVATSANYTIQSFETVTVGLTMDDACGESASASAQLFIPNQPLSITTVADTSICVGENAYLWASASGGEDGFIYQWSNDLNGDSITVEDATITSTLQVMATDICGRTITEEVTVNVLPISAGFHVQNLNDNLYEFTANPTPECPECDVLWNFGDGDLSSEWEPIHQFDGLDNYQVSLTMVNELGCSNTQYYMVIGTALIYIPTSFTPNGDGVNDTWHVVSNGIMEYEINIFNRWGDVVFSSTDPSEAWLGGDQANGVGYYGQNEVYNYAVRIKGFDSETYKTRGTIMLIR